jgi:hypothetical protein
MVMMSRVTDNYLRVRGNFIKKYCLSSMLFNAEFTCLAFIYDSIVFQLSLISVAMALGISSPDFYFTEIN